MNYKHLSLLISIIFIISFVSMAVCAHPGHGSEYVEEVQSSGSSSSSGGPTSSGGSVSSGGSSVSSSGSSGSSGYTGSGSSGSVGTTSSDESSGISEVNDNSTVNEVNKTDNNTKESNGDLFSLNNIILLIVALLCGFFIAIISSKLLFKK